MNTTFTRLAGLALAILLSGALGAGEPPAPSSASKVGTPSAVTTSLSEADAPAGQAEGESEAPGDPPMRFGSPDAAAMALIDAAATEGPDALLAVLGSDLEELVSGDPVADAADRQRFVALAQASASIEDETDDSAILVVGPED